MAYHINNNGDAKLCKAQKQCPFGDFLVNHYETIEEARASYENRQQRKQAEINFGWPKQSETRIFTTSSGGEITCQISREFSSMGTHHSVQAWLKKPGEGNVSFISLLVRGEEYSKAVGPHLAMSDIETRLDSRGKGYALELRQAIEKETGLLIYSSGSFTPEGWNAFGAHVRTLPESGGYGQEPGVKFQSMGFVLSWKDRVPRFIDSEIRYSPEQREAAWNLEDRMIALQEKEILWSED